MPDNDALFVSAHSWVLETATTLTVVAATGEGVTAIAPFATPGALLAMKLHAI
jgi:hypothetical protein